MVDGLRWKPILKPTNVDQLKSCTFETIVAGWVAIISVFHILYYLLLTFFTVASPLSLTAHFGLFFSYSPAYLFILGIGAL